MPPKLQETLSTLVKQAQEGMVQFANDNGPCQIAGIIESETVNFFKTVKTYDGFFIRHKVKKQSIHIDPCNKYPKRENILKRWFQPGRDMKGFKN